MGSQKANGLAPGPHEERSGFGGVEYALIFLFAAVVVIVVLAVICPSTNEAGNDIFRNIVVNI